MGGIVIGALMNLNFGRCRVRKLNMARCLTEREQEYYNWYRDGMSYKKLRKLCGSEFPTIKDVSEVFHISYEQAEELYNAKLDKQYFKQYLLDEINRFPADQIRKVQASALYIKDDTGNITDIPRTDNEIVWFENECVRRTGVDLTDVPLLEEFVILKCGSVSMTSILEQIIKRGVMIDGNKYVFYTSSTGQMKDSEITLVSEAYWNANKETLMCGLTEEHINECGGINMGKFMAAKALNISNSMLYDSGVSIDEVIIVPDFSTIVTGMVNYLDVNTLECKQTEKDIPIDHMDGAGIFVPGTFPCSCQIRGGWLKGAVFPFDFHEFIETCREQLSDKNMVDAWGDPVTVDEFLQAKMILTDSQLKMRKYYNSMEEYRDCFKRAGLSITINNCAYSHNSKTNSEIRLAYQPFQTMPRKNMTDEAVEKLCKRTIDYITGKNPLMLMGVDLENMDEVPELNALYASIVRYPALLQDGYVKKKLESAWKAIRKQAQGCRLYMEGLWSYICPDLFAFCQWLFLGQDEPEGLIPEGHVYNHYYIGKNIEETCCLRYPHLSDCEHGIRKVLQSEKCQEWFAETDTIVSCHDLISKVLQADWDGDHICLVHDKAFLDVLDRNQYPLFYDMTKADATPIANEKIMVCLKSSFHNEPIGYVSNSITKIFNSVEEPNTDLVRVLCAYNNFVIDYFKTQKSLNLKEYAERYEAYKDDDQHKCPHFFMYAKDKTAKSCELYNEKSNADRISEYVRQKTKGNMKVDVSKLVEPEKQDVFNPEMLKDLKIEVKRTDLEYDALKNLLLELKQERISLFKKVRDDLKLKASNEQLFVIYCRKKIRDIITDEGKAVNYLADIEYYAPEHQDDKQKDILWNCYGDVLFKNLCTNIQNRTKVKARRSVKRSLSKLEEEIVNQKETVEEEQQKLAEISISKPVYDYLMDISTRANRRYDKYIMFVLYVLIARWKNRYKDTDDYIRIYYNKKQGNKITCATIDRYIGSECTKKGLEQLEKKGYIRREFCNNYEKVWLTNIPDGDEQDILFTAESANPLLDLWERNKDRKIAKCEICGRKFVVAGNMKTCSDACSKRLQVRNKNKSVTE